MIKASKIWGGGGGNEGMCEIISSNICVAQGRSCQLKLRARALKEKRLSCLLKLTTKTFFKMVELMALKSFSVYFWKKQKQDFTSR